MNELLAILTAFGGGFIGGMVGVGGGILFVPALTVFLSLSQVQGEATSLAVIVLVGLAGAARQNHYGNVNFRAAALIAAFSPVGVAVGVVVSNAVPERALELGFAALALLFAWRLVKRAIAPEPAGPG